ncbi:serine/threonine dehydratase [Alteromonas sp. ASW11-36]|uniref:Serine/threonine dehydratase n=1 Tax=Alteromonas arenosi TaxID=3055817 RepID=A0ABT7SZ49_9ALTE|nr:serine/threonine dehydratase [Alteromonas sp. ASW11-36]MDM7861463.1 serine/threonine dehydratase [Alteromonas sp. ASW11-36]
MDFSDIKAAHTRIKPMIKRTPIVSSKRLNQWLSGNLAAGNQHEVFFKAECLQTTGAFKLRGASNFIAKLLESGENPRQFVANSSGNHAQAVAYAARKFGVPATIYAADTISPIKAAATQSYGAELKTFAKRTLADAAVAEASQADGVVWIPPFNHPDIIAGQGTAALEAIEELESVDAVFAPCGGGGLVSGSLVTTRALAPKAQVIGAEPLAANDAAESLRQGTIQYLTDTPKTLADGAATPSVGEHTFPFLQQLDGFYEVSEQQICYWTQWLHHLLKLHIEPTCCMTMSAVAQWLSNQTRPQRVLVILSGGNISSQSMQTIHATDYLAQPPSLIE